MIETFQNLPKSSLADLFDYLEPKSYLVILRYPIVPISIIIAIVNNSLSFSRVYLVLIGGKIEYFFKFLYLGDL